MKRFVLLAVLLLSVSTPISAVAQSVPVFRLGFMALADQIPSIAGQPLENEHYGANGDGLQQTTTGLMVWRKADNWTAFTNGSRTWINGPFGVQDRLNEERFAWEAPAPATTTSAQPLPQAESSAAVRGEGLRVDIQSLTSTVRQGQRANLTVSTISGLSASFVIDTPAGPAYPGGRDGKISDCGGQVYWAWTVDSSLPVGTWPLVVTVESAGDRVTAKTTITILAP